FTHYSSLHYLLYLALLSGNSHSISLLLLLSFFFLFFFNDPATTEIYTLSLHDALPICRQSRSVVPPHAGSTSGAPITTRPPPLRSEEYTSELQSPYDLVCRLLLEKKKKKKQHKKHTTQ